MNLQKKFIISIIEAISIVTLVLIAFSIVSFESNFDRYLENVKEKKFAAISKDIENRLKNSSIYELSQILDNYANTENIEIMIVDRHSSRQVVFNELDRNSGIPLITKTFYIESENTFNGIMNVSYYNTDKRDELQVEFYNNLILAIVLSLIVSIITGSLAAFWISNQLSRPITMINDLALSFKNKDYSIKSIENCNIKEVDQLKTNMEYLGRELEKQESIRKKYAQDISHELRTPLTNLKLHIEGILDGIIDRDDENLEAMNKEVDYLSNLVEKLRLTFSTNNNYEEKKIGLIRVDQIVEDVVSQFRATANSKKIKIDFRTCKIISKADTDSITQIINNLISNAINAAKQNGNIEVTLLNNGDSYVIEVKDDGIGIKEEDLINIFERFYRTEESKARSEKGSGLGLSITKSIVESMDGKIKVHSELGKGTTFTLEFKIIN